MSNPPPNNRLQALFAPPAPLLPGLGGAPYSESAQSPPAQNARASVRHSTTSADLWGHAAASAVRQVVEVDREADRRDPLEAARRRRLAGTALNYAAAAHEFDPYSDFQVCRRCGRTAEEVMVGALDCRGGRNVQG